jgi:hypothetical protein
MLPLSCCTGTGKLCLARGTLENILFETMLQAIQFFKLAHMPLLPRVTSCGLRVFEHGTLEARSTIFRHFSAFLAFLAFSPHRRCVMSTVDSGSNFIFAKNRFCATSKESTPKGRGRGFSPEGATVLPDSMLFWSVGVSE